MRIKLWHLVAMFAAYGAAMAGMAVGLNNLAKRVDSDPHHQIW